MTKFIFLVLMKTQGQAYTDRKLCKICKVKMVILTNQQIYSTFSTMQVFIELRSRRTKDSNTLPWNFINKMEIYSFV
jgi:hypothetical protein